MSRLDELIKELCPNGVEFQRIKDVCDDVIVPMRDRPKTFDGNIPWCRIEDKEGQYFNKILYLIFDYPHKHYTFKHFEI